MFKLENRYNVFYKYILKEFYKREKKLKIRLRTSCSLLGVEFAGSF